MWNLCLEKWKISLKSRNIHCIQWISQFRASFCTSNTTYLFHSNILCCTKFIIEIFCQKKWKGLPGISQNFQKRGIGKQLEIKEQGRSKTGAGQPIDEKDDAGRWKQKILLTEASIVSRKPIGTEDSLTSPAQYLNMSNNNVVLLAPLFLRPIYALLAGKTKAVPPLFPFPHFIFKPSSIFKHFAIQCYAEHVYI